MRSWLLALIVAAWLAPYAARATTTDDFLVRRTEDLIDLCTTPESDPLYTAALNFCHGYVVGAFNYHQELNLKAKRKLLCMPDPPPTRTEGVREFIAWAKAHPQYKNESPVETLVEFLVEKWPCRK